MNILPVNYQNQKTNFTAKIDAPKAMWTELKRATKNNPELSNKVINALDKIKKTQPDEVLVLKKNTYGTYNLLLSTPKNLFIKYVKYGIRRDQVDSCERGISVPKGLKLNLVDGHETYDNHTAFIKSKGEKIAETNDKTWVGFFLHAAVKFAGKQSKKNSAQQGLLNNLIDDLKA